jgi:DNA polymerase III delta prime subunit
MQPKGIYMSELSDSQWIEKYRPGTFDDLILEHKDTIQKLLKSPTGMPSIILYSSKPGTGKTSLAKLIIKELGCDCLALNSSLDRSIDFVRDQVSHFARCMSSVSGVKRCVFMDEADGLLKAAQESLRNLMEEYADNVFFIFTANSVGKIIEPIQSRCQKFAFESPSKADIMVRLDDICGAESYEVPPEALEKLIDKYYPDMRKMINALQIGKLKGLESFIDETIVFQRFLDYIKTKQVGLMCQTVYSGDFDILGFNNWYFHKLYQESTTANFDYTRKVAMHLANVEKYSNLQVNLELIAISEYLGIAGL